MSQKQLSEDEIFFSLKDIAPYLSQGVRDAVSKAINKAKRTGKVISVQDRRTNSEILAFWGGELLIQTKDRGIIPFGVFKALVRVLA